MMKIKLRSKSLLVYLIFVWVVLMIANSVYGQEKRKPPSRTFVSENGEYIVTVKYEDWHGKGDAHYVIKDKKGVVVSKFTTDIAPAHICVSNNGRNIIAFGGSWREILPFLNKMVFYDFKGNIIKKYELNIPLAPCIGAMVFSKEGDIFVMGLWYDFVDYLKHMDEKKMIRTNVLILFDVHTGKVIRQFKGIDVDAERSKIAVSENAEWIILCGPTGKGWDEKAILFDKNGKKHWEKLWKQKKLEGVFVAKDISADGRTFEIEQHQYGTEVIKKLIYSNIKGKVKLEKTIEIEEPKD